MKQPNKARYLVIGILLPILLALPHLMVAAHNPLAFYEQENLRHLLLPPVSADISAHAHDHGVAREQQLNHLHGHDSADHAHESVHSPRLVEITLARAQSWPPVANYSYAVPRHRPPERPPRVRLHT